MCDCKNEKKTEWERCKLGIAALILKIPQF